MHAHSKDAHNIGGIHIGNLPLIIEVVTLRAESYPTYLGKSKETLLAGYEVVCRDK